MTEPSRKLHFKPATLFIILALSIIIADTVTMVIMDRYLVFLGGTREIFINSALLTLFLLPALYVLLFKPLSRSSKAQKAKETELAEQRLFTEDIIQNSTIPLFVINTSRQVIFWNKACEELTGISAGEIINTGDHWKAFYNTKRPLLCDIVLDGSIEVLPSYYNKYGVSPLLGHGAFAEGWFDSLNGKKRYLHFSAAPIYNSKNEIIAVMETLVDLTENKNYEEALHLKTVQLESLIENMHAGILFEDAERRVLLANKIFCKMFGPQGEPCNLIGKNSVKVIAYIHDRLKNPARDLNELPPAVAEKQILESVELDLISDRRIRCECIPVAEDHKLSGYLWIFRDRTRELTLEAQLRHSQKMESVGLLAGGVAHDFNNTLTIILSYASLLREKLVPVAGQKELVEYVDEVIAAGQRTAELTKSLLAFSRKQTMTPAVCDLNAIIRNLRPLIRKVTAENVSLELLVGTECLPLTADKSLIEHMLLNLVKNAKDAMPDGGTLTIETATRVLGEHDLAGCDVTVPGRYAVISVRDTGTGIESTAQDKVFEPFFSTKEVGSGTGLGLSLVYGTVKQHGGGIKVSSARGMGATFDIFLPAPDEGAKPGAAKSEVAPKNTYQGTETILMAEDDAIIRKIQKLVLTGSGYTVIDAADGREAVELFSQHRETIQLVILDVVMPHMNGTEACKAILAAKPDTPVLFISGYPGERLTTLKSSSAFQFLTKPVTPRQLLEQVRSMLDEACGDGDTVSQQPQA